jgi:hypothetical protein
MRAPITNGLNTVRKQYTEAGSKLKNMRKYVYFYSTLLYIIFPVSTVLQGRQNMKIGLFPNKILFQNKFFYFVHSNILARPFC